MRIRGTGFVLLAAALVGMPACSTDPPPPASPAPSASRASAAPASSGTAAAPVLGAWHQLVHAERLGGTLLVNGGPESGGKAADDPLDVWAWDGRAWRPVAPAGTDGPRWRNFAAAAYDADRGVLVVQGGLQGRGGMLQETWEWDGTAWHRFGADGPGGREGARMAYDAARKVTVLVGGATARGEVPADTWAWDGAGWRRLATDGPRARFPGLLEYDAARRTVVLYGGHTPDGPYGLADTWLWDGSRWREASAASAPGARVNLAGAWHARLERVLLVAGGDEQTVHDDVWAWDGRAWARLPARGLPPRQGHGAAYDPGRDRLVVTGGLVTPGRPDRLQDVWEWDGARFARVR
jgi:hypothetical protein